MAKKRTIKKRTTKEELTYLAKMEFVNLVVIMFVYFFYTGLFYVNLDLFGAFADGQASLAELLPYRLNWLTFYPVLLLCIVLLEGSLYWFNLLNRTQRKKALSKKQIGSIFTKVKIVTLILYALYVPIFLLNVSQTNLLACIVAVCIYLFALIEYVNYFHVRLSFYTKDYQGLLVARPLRIIFQKEAGNPSKLAQEIAYYQKNS
ncbi:hypothetical protein [Enterococcus sp. AZ109]|uniref:hypothetical protein n=1 Tax=Enterococcus sp. AZ109 TaxID=2774634 RepID=UPI003F230EF9